MSTFQSIEFFVILNLFVIGLSHFVQPKIWVEFFQFLHKRGMVGNILNAMISLGLGSFILSFHLSWEWPMIIVTIYGVLQLLKGCTYLLFPSIGLNSIGKVDANYSKFKWVGLVMCVVALFLFVELINTDAFSM